MKREWSMVPAAQMRAYFEEAERLVALARQHSSPFAAALAGVVMIRNVLALMGGKPEWWCKLITSTEEEARDMLTPLARGNASEPDPLD